MASSAPSLLYLLLIKKKLLLLQMQVYRRWQRKRRLAIQKRKTETEGELDVVHSETSSVKKVTTVKIPNSKMFLVRKCAKKLDNVDTAIKRFAAKHMEEDAVSHFLLYMGDLIRSVPEYKQQKCQNVLLSVVNLFIEGHDEVVVFPEAVVNAPSS